MPLQWEQPDKSIQDQPSPEQIRAYYDWAMNIMRERIAFAAKMFNEEEQKAPGVETSLKRDLRDSFFLEQANLDYYRKLRDAVVVPTPNAGMAGPTGSVNTEVPK